MNSLSGGDGIRDLIKTVQIWRLATVLKYAVSFHQDEPATGIAGGRARAKGEKMHGGTTFSVGRPDAAYGDLSQAGGCKLGNVIGLMSPTPSGPRRISSSNSEFVPKLVTSSLAGKPYAFNEIVDHVAQLREFYSPICGNLSVDGGYGDCASLFTNL